MTEFDGTPQHVLNRAMQLAIRNDVDAAREQYQLARSMDHARTMNEDLCQLLEFVLSVQTRDAESARSIAHRLCSTQRGSELLFGFIEQHRQRLPPRTADLIADLAPREAPPVEGAVSKRAWIMGGSAVVVILLLGVIVAVFLPRNRYTGSSEPEIGDSAILIGDEVDNEQQGIDFDSVSQSVFLVITRVKILSDSGDVMHMPIGTGTAFAVHSDGKLLTNRHVVDGLDNLVEEYEDVTGWDVLIAWGSEDGQKTNAKIIHTSSYIDLAVLQVDRKFEHQLKLNYSPDVGESVVTYGYPGIASQVADSMSPEAALIREHELNKLLNTGKLSDIEISNILGPSAFKPVAYRGIVSALRSTEQGKMLQTDASIHGGMSGGPLLDSRGAVVGINSMYTTGSETNNFSLSSESIFDDLEHLNILKKP